MIVPNDADERVTVPGHLLSPRGGDHYVLRREAAEAGEMAVVLVGDESSIKRVYPEGAMTRLRPANPCLQDIRVPTADVKVQGIVVGLMRRF